MKNQVEAQSEQKPEYLNFLEGDLARRVRQNPQYSLRAYAKALSVDASLLSKILSGKRPLSLKMAKRVVKKLDLPVQQQQKFLQSTTRLKTSEGTAEEFRHFFEREDTQKINPNQFGRINWFFTAIAEFCQQKGFEDNPRVISKIFGISYQQARMAIEDLVGGGLLHRENGRLYKKTKDTFVDWDALPSAVNRGQHRGFLVKALEAMDIEPDKNFRFEGGTMGMDPRDLPKAAKLMNKYRDEFSDLLQDAESQRRKIYRFELFMIPLERH